SFVWCVCVLLSERVGREIYVCVCVCVWVCVCVCVCARLGYREKGKSFVAFRSGIAANSMQRFSCSDHVMWQRLERNSVPLCQGLSFIGTNLYAEVFFLFMTYLHAPMC